jgi:hypothetical protein
MMSDITEAKVAVVRRLVQPGMTQIEVDRLAVFRSDTVRRHRAQPQATHLGPWYRSEDWADDGTLIATGRAAAMALDPWASARRDRIAGKPWSPWPATVPPIQPLRFAGVEYPDVNEAPELVNNAPDNAPVVNNAAVEDDDVNYARDYKRERRAAEKLGITAAEFRAQQGLPPRRKRGQP